MNSAICRGSVLLVCLSLSSCSSEEKPFRKDVVPVTGQLQVDGQPPGSRVQIQAHPVGPADTEHPTYSSATSDPDGKFTFSTYETGDGLPPGSYRLTVSWQEFNAMSSGFSGPDKLNGRYSSQEDSKLEVTVETEKPVDLGIIELTTK